jgi:hypothetical protein
MAPYVPVCHGREGAVRGFTKAARIERMTSDRRAELDGGGHAIIRRARRAIVEVIEAHAGAGPRLDPCALAATAISGLFADAVCRLASAPDIIELINRQLAGVGLQLVPTPRN